MAEIDPLRSGNITIRTGNSASARILPKKDDDIPTQLEITIAPGKTTAKELHSILSSLNIDFTDERSLEMQAGDNKVFDDAHELTNLDYSLEWRSVVDWLKKLGAKVDISVEARICSLVDSKEISQEYLNSLKELVQAGLRLDWIIESLTMEKALNPGYIAALKDLRSSGILIDGRVIKYLSLRKALNCDFINALKCLKSRGVNVSFNTINALSLECGTNRTYINSLLRLHNAGFDLSGLPSIDTKGFSVQMLPYEKGINLQYMDLLIRSNGNINEANLAYLDLRGVDKSLLNQPSTEALSLESVYKDSNFVSYVHKVLAVYLKNGNDEVLQQIIMERFSEYSFGGLKHLLLHFAWMMNELHSLPDAKRAEIIESFSSKELYVLLACARQEVYTSTFNIIFKRLLEKMRQEKIDGMSLLREADPRSAYYRQVLTMFSSYGKLGEFLGTIADVGERNALLKRFTAELALSRDMLMDGVSIAELLYNENDPDIIRQVSGHILASFAQETDPEVKKIYGIIGAIYYSKGGAEAFRAFSEIYHIKTTKRIGRDELLNKNNEIIEQQYFYNDEDGKSNYDSLIEMYKGKPDCSFEDKGSYIIITKSSADGIILKIYANKPDKERGITEIHEEFNKKEISSIIVVHRGHSYHASKTIAHIPPIARIVYLGSCGGFLDISDVLNNAPGASIISTKGMGTVLVNLPLIRNINNAALSPEGVNWENVWADIEKSLSGDTYRKSLFEYYVRPDQNIAALLYYTYNHSK